MFLLIIYSPVQNADAIRNAAASAGAGRIGQYEACSFSSRGTGRFRPLEGANPMIGTIDMSEETEEERIEMVAPRDRIKAIMAAILEVHPYEEPAIHVLSLESYKSLAEAD